MLFNYKLKTSMNTCKQYKTSFILAYLAIIILTWSERNKKNLRGL